MHCPSGTRRDGVIAASSYSVTRNGTERVIAAARFPEVGGSGDILQSGGIYRDSGGKNPRDTVWICCHCLRRVLLVRLNVEMK